MSSSGKNAASTFSTGELVADAHLSQQTRSNLCEVVAVVSSRKIPVNISFFVRPVYFTLVFVFYRFGGIVPVLLDRDDFLIL
jgi:hypothetical protein